MIRRHSFLLAIVLLIVLSSCNAPTRQPIVVVPTVEPQQTATLESLLPSPTPAEPAAPTPTLPAPAVTIAATAAPATPTDTGLQPTATATAASAELPTAADQIAAGINPLTGLEVGDPATLLRRPILCKISNYPAGYVRPQSGIASADIIFEHYAEGVATRFSAIFYGSEPAQIGPIRSARLIDLELIPMYDAALCFSGASDGITDRLEVAPYQERVLWAFLPGYFRTGENKPFEHTFYSRLQPKWNYLAQVEAGDVPSFDSVLVFSEEPPLDNSAPASHIAISYGDGAGTFVDWFYDAGSGLWQRWADGQRFIDALTRTQVTASNVIIVKAPHYVDRTICENQGAERCLSYSTEIQLWGGGFASIFRDGRQIDGSWQRDDRGRDGQFLTFYDSNGQPVPLKPGNTWIQVTPYDEYINTPIVIE